MEKEFRRSRIYQQHTTSSISSHNHTIHLNPLLLLHEKTQKNIQKSHSFFISSIRLNFPFTWMSRWINQLSYRNLLTFHSRKYRTNNHRRNLFNLLLVIFIQHNKQYVSIVGFRCQLKTPIQILHYYNLLSSYQYNPSK